MPFNSKLNYLYLAKEADVYRVKESVRRMTPKVLSCAKPFLVSPNPKTKPDPYFVERAGNLVSCYS